MQRFAFAAIVVVACSAGEGDDVDTPPFTGFLTPAPGAAGTTGGAAPGAPSAGAAGGGAGPASTNGMNPTSAGAAGGSATAGGAGSGNTNESNGNVGPLQPSGTGGSGGQSTPPGAAGAPAQPDPVEPTPNEPDPGEPAAGGPFVSRPVNGGASAAFACPENVAFGNPLAGMGAVQTISPPTTSFFAFIEGPVWVGSVGRLFFSDNASGPERIWQLTPPSTVPEIFLASSGSNGLAIDNADQLLLADQRDRRITRVSSTTAANLGEVLPAGQYRPNDLVLRSDENLYFTDPDSQGRGFYRLSPAGELSGPFTQANGPNAPNGVVLSPDENTLYVGDVQQRFVASFPLLLDGAIDTANGTVFVRTTGDTVDGMAVDCAGNVYVGTRTGVEVYAPDASFIGTVPTGEASNATFGGADRRTLYVTSRSVLKAVTLAVPGLPD